MTQELYEKHREEYLRFDRVENKKSNRPDLHAFILLDQLVPGNTDIIAASAHDEFFLATDPEELSRVATEDQIIELIRCGVRYSSCHDSLSMFS